MQPTTRPAAAAAATAPPTAPQPSPRSMPLASAAAVFAAAAIANSACSSATTTSSTSQTMQQQNPAHAVAPEAAVDPTTSFSTNRAPLIALRMPAAASAATAVAATAPLVTANSQQIARKDVPAPVADPSTEWMDMEVDDAPAARRGGSTAAASAASIHRSATVTVHSGLSPSLSSTLSLSPAPPPSLRDPVAFPAGSIAKFKWSESLETARAKAPKRSALKNQCGDPKGCVTRGWCSCTKRVSEVHPFPDVAVAVAAASSTSTSSVAAVAAPASSHSSSNNVKRTRFAAKPQELLRAAVFSPPRITSPSPFNPSKAERGKKKREWRRAQQENREEPDEALETAAAADKPALLEWYRELDRRVEEALRNSDRQAEQTENSADHRAAREEAAKRPRAEDDNDEDEEEEGEKDDEDDEDDEVVITQPKANGGSNARVNAAPASANRNASAPPSAAPRSPISQQPKRVEAQPHRPNDKAPAHSSAPLKQQHAPQQSQAQLPSARPIAPSTIHAHSLSGLMLQQQQRQKQEADEAKQTRTISQLKAEFCVHGAAVPQPRNREQPARAPAAPPAAVTAAAITSAQPTRTPAAAAPAQPKPPQQQPPPPPPPPHRPPPPREQFSNLRDVDEVDRSRKRKQPAASSLLRALDESTPFLGSGSLTSAFNSSSSSDSGSVRHKKPKKPGIIAPLRLTNAAAARKKAAQDAKAATVRSRQPRRTITHSMTSLPRGLPPAAPTPSSAAVAPFSAALNSSANRSEPSSAYPPLNRSAAVLDPRAPVSPQINLISPDVGRSMEIEPTSLQTANAALRSSIVAPPPRAASASAASAFAIPFAQSSLGAMAASAIPLMPLVAPVNFSANTPHSPPLAYRPHVTRETVTGRYCCDVDQCTTKFNPNCWWRHMVAHFKSKHPAIYEIIAPLDVDDLKRQGIWNGPSLGSNFRPLPIIHPPGTAPMATALAATMHPPIPQLPMMHLQQQPFAAPFAAAFPQALMHASSMPPMLPRMTVATPSAVAAAFAPPQRVALPPPRRTHSPPPPIAFTLPPGSASSAPAPTPTSSRSSFPTAMTDHVPDNIRGIVTRKHSEYQCVQCEQRFDLKHPAHDIHKHAKSHAESRKCASLFSMLQ